MNTKLLPSIWLIIFLVGLPQLSETVYTPALPEIAVDLATSVSMVEYTLTIYLFGFALGTLFWGYISDRLGRKPCVLAGLIVFIIGCIGCNTSSSIEMLMLCRFVQALGGSIGSVLGQSICRDAFHGPELGKVYSLIGSALALFPAVGPMMGGIIAESYGWEEIFIFLGLFATVLLIITAGKLPETHPKHARVGKSLISVALRLVKDKKVIAFGLIVSACNGIMFSYFGEGPFYLMEILGLSPSTYGVSFMFIAASSAAGGFISKKMHDSMSSIQIMRYGIYIMLISTCLLSLVAVTNHFIYEIPSNFMIMITIVSQMLTSMGLCIATSNALALSVVNYKDAIGIASSLFGFFYYMVISIFTLIMGTIHNGTLLPMPIYFFILSCFMLLISKLFLKE